MKIDKEKLFSLAVEENEDEKRMSSLSRENRDFYKASMKIAMKIKRAIRLSAMNQAQLAQKMGMDPAALSRLLNGKANLELKTIVRFEKELGINIIDRSISPFSQSSQRYMTVNTYYVSNIVLAAPNKFTGMRKLDMPTTIGYSYPVRTIYSKAEDNEISMVSEPWEIYS